jgi:hypothetical protein
MKGADKTHGKDIRHWVEMDAATDDLTRIVFNEIVDKVASGEINAEQCNAEMRQRLGAITEAKS